MANLHADGPRVLARVRVERMGFVNEEEVAVLAADPRTRLQQLVVRCGCGRFVVAAQDAKHFIDIVEASRQDYIRDVALLAASEVLHG